MSRFNARRYVAIETAASVAINAVLNVAPAALSAQGQDPAPIPGTFRLSSDAVLPLFMGALMSALVPSLLALRRQHAGRLPAFPDRGGPTFAQAILLPLLLAASVTGLGLLLAGTALPLLAGRSVTPGALLLFKASCGGLIAALVTPLALLLLFGRGWDGNHGPDRRAGDRPGAVAVRDGDQHRA